MHGAPKCRICSGMTVLVARGRATEHSHEAYAPTYHGVGGHGDLFRCRECGTVQQPSIPSGERLEGLYRDMRDDDYLLEEAGRRQTARRLLDQLAPSAPTGRLLDVGCGHGLLLDEARRRGYVVQGLELSRDSARYGRETLGLPVDETPLEALDPDCAEFDAIVLADVLEHVTDPVATIDRCAQLLAPGGALMVVTPDPASITARLAGPRWWGYIPAHHCLIPRRTLAELISGTGLVIARDVPLRRSFSLAYWVDGLTERGEAARRLARLVSASWGQRMVSLSLGDERIFVACRTPVAQPTRRLLVDRGQETKIHVVVPAYCAARTVGLVAAELPAGAADRVLLVDDASPDETASTALEAGFEVLVHPVNRGYGANQKTCYTRAALDGADIVVMVHGDNQYDPALAAQMVLPIVEGRADVVVGSRLLEDEAISGGMPRWKWVGNRGLTWVENRVFDRDFSEYHTGYRAFSVAFLRSIPFLRNSDDFVFDQEIFAQMIAGGARVKELPIPTKYFLEASSVSFSKSVVYGLKTLGVLARFAADRRGRPWTLLRRPATTLRGPTGARGSVPDGGTPLATREHV